jgi:hypothetical protein
MTLLRPTTLSLVAVATLLGCAGKKDPPYGREPAMFLPGTRAQTWAVAPVLNLSGQQGVDALLQADLVYAQLQPVKGLTVVPVNRVVEVYAALNLAKVQSEDQAAAVCDALGVDALLVPTVTAFDPYNPPKLGASLQLFKRSRGSEQGGIDPRALARSAAPPEGAGLPRQNRFAQVVGMYDAANGSVRDALMDYASGRYSPRGPLGAKEYFVNMDRYCGFVYHDLILKLLDQPQLNPG